MEILTASQPEQELARWLTTTLGKALIGLPTPDMKLSVVFQNSQTNKIARQVINQALFEPQNLISHLPDLNPDEISHQGLKQLLDPLKQRDPHNKFGGIWNEWTAKLAALKLGLPDHKLAQQIAAPGPTGQKLRQEQASVAKQTEAALRKLLLSNPPENLRFSIKLETWVKRQIPELRQQVAQLFPSLGKQETGQAITDVLLALTEILNFSPGQNLPIKLIRDTLVSGRLGQSVNLVDLHCPLFDNSPISGVMVEPSADDKMIRTADGSRLKISHDGFFDGVSTLANILAKHKISLKIVVFLIDNDKFVMPGQESNIHALSHSLLAKIRQHPLSTHPHVMVKASEAVSLEEFIPEWERRNCRSSTLTERLVDAEFERLQPKTLPPEMKTREFARQIAQKAFVQQFAFGAGLPEMFKPAIILQRTRAHQQASEIFRLGNRKCPESGIIIAHWKDREIVV